MNLKIENIGLIEEADIDLLGLTVIAGENDSGKSTVGKLMFSIIKAISKFKSELKEDRESNIFDILEKIYFNSRRDFIENDKFRELFHPRYFLDEILSDSFTALENRIDFFKKEGVYSGRIFDLFENLKTIINQKEDKQSAQKRAFKKIIYSEFRGDIVRQNSNGNAFVEILEDNKSLLKIEFENNELKSFDVKEELYLNDVILIETPMILNMSDSIRNSKVSFEQESKENRIRYLGRANIAFHIKDLDDKLRDSGYEDLFYKDGDLSKSISKVIDGKIKYVPESEEFIYYKGEEQHKILNVASGIKSFGIIQMLLSSGFLDDRTLIILDEPEVHLHPIWQLKYAEIITLLVKNGANILVTTHSPYMLEALEKYTEKYKTKENTTFYLSGDNKIITHKNNSLSLKEIFKKLAEPYGVFDELDASRL